MDSENRLLEEIKKLIPFIQEDFLISITNKGIVNRSKKDLEAVRDSISITINEEGNIQGTMAGDIQVTLNSSLQNSVCSCPSQNTCKHIVTLLFYIKEYFDKNSGSLSEQAADAGEAEKKEGTEAEGAEKGRAETPPAEKPYAELDALTVEEACSLLGKRDFNSIVRSLQIKEEAAFSYGDLLTVTINSQNAKVYFPKEKSIENALCSCKEKGMCRHKAYAILSYLQQERKVLLEAETPAIEIGEEEEEFLGRLQGYAAGLLEKGLASLTENEITTMDKLYRRAYGLKLFRTAAELKGLSSDFGLYFSKNVAFNAQRTLHHLCAMYNRCEALLAGRHDERKKLLLAGMRREESIAMDNLSFIGLGADCRLTRRKDLLVSGYFYCQELKTVQIASVLRPYENHMTADYLYYLDTLWAEDLSMHQASASKLLLKDVKMTTGRLSGSKSTACKIQGKTAEEEFQAIAITDFRQLMQQLKQKTFQYFEMFSESERIFVLKIDRMEEIHFDKIGQQLKFTAYDSQNTPIVLSISYSPVTQTAIKYLESNKSKPFQYILGSIQEKNDTLTGKFISGMRDGKVENIFFQAK